MFLSVSEVPLLRVFTEHHQMSRIKTVRQFKSKIWEMKRGGICKVPRQDSGQCNFSEAKYSDDSFAQIYKALFGDAMLDAHPNGH